MRVLGGIICANCAKVLGGPRLRYREQFVWGGCKLGKYSGSVGKSGTCWINLSKLSKRPLRTPVRKLVKDRMHACRLQSSFCPSGSFLSEELPKFPGREPLL